MWLLFKRVNKIHVQVLMFITNLDVPITVSFNLRITQQPHHPNECQPRTHLRPASSTAHVATIFKYTTFKPGALEPGRGGNSPTLESRSCAKLFYFLWHVYIAESSGWKQNMLSYKEIWSLYICLFVCFLFVCQFWKLVYFLFHKPWSHTFRSTSKAWPSPLKPFSAMA
jgi:hypothetical protein